jgi:hypothetical protein
VLANMEDVPVNELSKQILRIVLQGSGVGKH